MAFITRNAIRTVSGLLSERALVLVEGPPRCGLSTLARQLASCSPSGAVLVDARLREGRDIIAAPGEQSAARPIVLDNASEGDARALDLWAKSVTGLRTPRFALIGGPFSGEGLAAPVVKLGPYSVFEAGRASTKRLWLRGGYPEAYGAPSDEAAAAWLEGYAADLAYGGLARWGLSREPERIAALLHLVAASNGEAFNENDAARALGSSRPTVLRRLEALERAGIIYTLQALPSYLAPGVSRSARSKATYIKDSGLLHSLLGIRSGAELAAGAGGAAASWSGLVVGQALAMLPPGSRLYRYGSADGASLDMVVVRDGAPLLAASASRHRPISVSRATGYAALAIDKGVALKRYIVVPDGDDRKLPGGFLATSLGSFLDRVASV